MTYPTIGIDTAKDIFHLCLGDAQGRPLQRRKLRRNKLAAFIAQQPRSRIFLEACGGAHYWSRRFTELGHEVQQIAPQFVKKYRNSDKNDYNDAQACIEAGLRPTMRFVGTKSVDQQTLQSHQTVRRLVMNQRNALGNQLRGILSEFGIVIPKSIAKLRTRVPEILEDGDNQLTDAMRALIAEEYQRWLDLCQRTKQLTKRLEQLSKADPLMRRLQDELSGVGPLSAVGLCTAVADTRLFANGRRFSAYLGLVPRQWSTGDKPRLLGIRKGGQSELRSTLIHGARSVIRHLGDKQDPLSCWLRDLVQRRGKNCAAVALANKNARQAWAIMNQGVAV